MGINFNTEDLNEWIVKMCEFAGIPVMDEVLWGTYGKSGKEPLRYVKLCECSTEHLNEILKIGELSLVVKLCIQKILKERVDK